MSMPNVPHVVNLDYLHELAGSNTAFVDEMIALFLSEVPVQLAAIDAAIRALNYPQLYHAAHKMKSTILFMGLSDVLDPHLDALETLGKNHGAAAQCLLHAQETRRICDTAVAELNARA